MRTVSLLTMTILWIFLIYNLYLLHRNKKVSDFRGYIIALISTTIKWQIEKGLYKEQYWQYHFDAMWALCKKHSYNRMLHSFKPLRLKVWYSEEEMKAMNGEIIFKKEQDEKV